MAAGRRTSLLSLAGEKVDDVPGRSDPLLLTLPLANLVPTRFNPRRNFGTEDDLKAFGLVLKRRQLQPAVVVSRAAYLKLWPEEESAVGAAQYVIANGERRYRGSLAAGLTTLNVVHNEDVAKSRADFLDAVLSENNDREDLDPIERALGIDTMVAELGGANRVAEHYGKSGGWVSQQRKLLKLVPELQQLVSAKEMPVRVARDVAGLPVEQQVAAWEKEKARRDEEAARRLDPKPANPAREESVAPVSAPASAPGPAPANPDPVYRGKEPAPEVPPAQPHPVEPAAAPVSPLPEPRVEKQLPSPPAPATDSSSPAAVPQPAPSPAAALQLPTHDWEQLAAIVIAELPEQALHSLTERLLEAVGADTSNQSA
ncbi:ParB N-terminal domain-containing protein [Streptomyces sp. DE06-01C]|uniref:ParB/RepB/Spo0J family partition protein n=1 Tax=Streptomyces sp. DE06-01C TaxID=3028656 RepID=UPI0029C1C97D|nr:ParB N-terminal domain-containing protein [Streptomyces sp. DE06-01C]MDX5526122.1 ParB N-terminal domain-containing protein [Streptomyces sp. DE06-01C]